MLVVTGNERRGQATPLSPNCAGGRAATSPRRSATLLARTIAYCIIHQVIRSLQESRGSAERAAWQDERPHGERRAPDARALPQLCECGTAGVRVEPTKPPAHDRSAVQAVQAAGRSPERRSITLQRGCRWRKPPQAPIPPPPPPPLPAQGGFGKGQQAGGVPTCQRCLQEGHWCVPPGFGCARRASGCCCAAHRAARSRAAPTHSARLSTPQDIRVQERTGVPEPPHPHAAAEEPAGALSGPCRAGHAGGRCRGHRRPCVCRQGMRVQHRPHRAPAPLFAVPSPPSGAHQVYGRL